MKLSDAELRELFQRSTARAEPATNCLSEEELVRAAQGSLGTGERDRIAGHIARCSDCAREFRIARGLAPIEAAARTQLAPQKASWLPVAAAVLLAIALPALVSLIAIHRRDLATIAQLRDQITATRELDSTTRQPDDSREARLQLDVPIVDLDADVTRGADAIPLITVPPTADVVTLILHLPEETSAPVDVELEGAAPMQLDARDNRSSITLALPRTLLKEGEHAITVRSRNRETKFHFRIDYP